MASDPTPDINPVERDGSIRALAELLAAIPAPPADKERKNDQDWAAAVVADRAEQIRRAAFLAAVMTSRCDGDFVTVTMAAEEYEVFLDGRSHVDNAPESAPPIGRSQNNPACPECKAENTKHIAGVPGLGSSTEERWGCPDCGHDWRTHLTRPRNHVELQS